MMRITSPSPLQLDRVDVTNLTVTFNEDALFAGTLCVGDGLDQYDTSADFDVRHVEGEPRKHVVTLELRVRSKKEAGAARFTRLDVRLHAIFTPDPEFGEEVIRQVIPGNCIAILHGVARGVVLAATSSCAGGPFLLPVINYQDLIAKKARAMKRRQAAQAQETPEGE